MYLRNRLTKPDGALAVVREYSVRWHRKPESMMSCFRLSGLASLKRNIRCDSNQTLQVIKLWGKKVYRTHRGKIVYVRDTQSR
jgi:hypothetical protein